MPRQVKRIKPLIYVFYEGESEQQYIDYLKSCFSDVAVIKRCSKRASRGLLQIYLQIQKVDLKRIKNIEM